MTSRHLVDPELLPVLELYPTITLTADNLQTVRGRPLRFTAEGDCGVDWEEREIAGPDCPITVRIYRPRDAHGPLPCIYHMHGGGFVLGNVAEPEFLHRPLSRDLQCVIVTVNYRLAPETGFPGNIEDCYAGLSWTFEHVEELGVDATRIGVMGESAGGGLAAALALLARDRGEYRIAFQHLIYPMLDDRTCTRAPHPHAGEFVWHAANNRFGWSALLGQEPGGEGVSPYAAAARAEDLRGLPPTFISTGALDLFVDEDIDFAARLIAAGVPTELHVWPGAFHGFDLVPGATVAEAARAASRAALRRAVAGTAA